MKTFVITMDPERRASMQKRCAEHDLSVEWVQGIDGKSLTTTDIKNHASPLCAGIYCTPAMIGCALSHYACWKKVVNENLPYALILEDDAVLLPHFPKNLAHALASTPKDFHILLAGCFLCSQTMQRLSTLGTIKATKNTVREISSFGGTHAYIISNAGARYLLHHTPKVKYHIDAQMSMTPGLKIYAVTENLSVQEDMTTSSMASFGFPYSLNTVLAGYKDSDNIAMSYYANVPIARLGTYSKHIALTPLLLLCIVLGVSLHASKTWRVVVMGYVLFDMIMYAPKHVLVDVTSKLGAVALGYYIGWMYANQIPKK